MATATRIKINIQQEIAKYNHPRNEWRIGVTKNLDDRKDSCGEPPTWKEWEAESIRDAQNIENFFLKVLEPTLQGETNGELDSSNPTWVYIFHDGWS